MFNIFILDDPFIYRHLLVVNAFQQAPNGQLIERIQQALHASTIATTIKLDTGEVRRYFNDGLNL